MLKIACIFSFKESNWVSCQKIVFNLHKSYQSCAGIHLENFNYSLDMDLNDCEQVANKILQYDPDIISIMDHKPHPNSLFAALNSIYPSKKRPKILIHVFGDYTLFYNHWETVGKLLEEYEVEFLVASERQKHMIDKMHHPSNGSVVCPFPVDHEEFYLDEKRRQKQRSQWGLNDDDVAFIFTGRLSRQKRIKSLLTVFSEEFEKDEKAHLFIYGNADNVGEPFFQRFDIEGEYFRTFYRKYKALPEQVKARIHFMGAVPNKDLLDAYQGADVLVNLSVHNDEDYGMSVAEAQACGLPAALTDWGGLAGFYQPEAVKYIPVKIGRSSKQVHLKRTKEILREFYQNPQREKRKQISERAIQNLGIKKVASIIQHTISKKSSRFAGHSKLFHELALVTKLPTSEPVYADKLGQINLLYRKVYSSYVRQNK